MSFDIASDFLADPFGGKGKLITATDDMRTWLHFREDGVIEQCVVTNTDPLLEETAQRRSENAGKRWGDGQAIGSVPLDLYFKSGLSEANTQRDTKWIKRWWNDADNKKLRTFEGNV
jgi:hypothetical protein